MSSSQTAISLQNPKFALRDLCQEDLPECLGFSPSSIGQEIIGLQKTIAVWKGLIGTPAFCSKVIEARQPHGKPRIAGFGARLFVARDFAESEISNPQPGLKARLISGIHRGDPVVLSKSEIRRANTHSGLDMVLFDGWRPGTLSAEASVEAYARLGTCFLEIHAGFWLNRMITELTSEAERARYLSTRVWRILDNFETFYSQHPGSPWAPGGCLAIITRADAFSVTAPGISTPFRPKRAELRLRDGDQRFLEVALTGLTDEELARKLNIGRASVKKRWLSLFDRVSVIRPDLFPQPAALADREIRGRQKRHLLLAHIRSHPEELQPFEW